MTNSWGVGDLIEIPLSEGRLGYCQVLEDPLYVFYDKGAQFDHTNFQSITVRPVLFKVWVSKYARLNGSWKRIGRGLPVRTDMPKPDFFRQDPITKKLYRYNQQLDNSEPISFEEALQMERAAVWEPEHVEERLQAHFDGTDSIWKSKLAPKPL